MIASAAVSLYNRLTLVEKMAITHASPDGLSWKAHNEYRTDFMMFGVEDPMERETAIIEVRGMIKDEFRPFGVRQKV